MFNSLPSLKICRLKKIFPWLLRTKWARVCENCRYTVIRERILNNDHLGRCPPLLRAIYQLNFSRARRRVTFSGEAPTVTFEMSELRNEQSDYLYLKQIFFSIMQVIDADCCEGKTEFISFLRFVAPRKAISLLHEFLGKVKWFMNKWFALYSAFFRRK